MCAAKEREELKDLHLGDVDDFIYINQGNNPIIDNVDDEKEFGKTHEALKLFGFSDENCKNIFKIMAAILHLGNVKICGRGDSETSTVCQKDVSLPIVASFLEVDVKVLRKCVTRNWRED